LSVEGDCLSSEGDRCSFELESWSSEHNHSSFELGNCSAEGDRCSFELESWSFELGIWDSELNPSGSKLEQ
jgi:hypothetical protein